MPLRMMATVCPPQNSIRRTGLVEIMAILSASLRTRPASRNSSMNFIRPQFYLNRIETYKPVPRRSPQPAYPRRQF